MEIYPARRSAGWPEIGESLVELDPVDVHEQAAAHGDEEVVYAVHLGGDRSLDLLPFAAVLAGDVDGRDDRALEGIGAKLDGAADVGLAADEDGGQVRIAEIDAIVFDPDRIAGAVVVTEDGLPAFERGFGAKELDPGVVGIRDLGVAVDLNLAGGLGNADAALGGDDEVDGAVIVERELVDSDGAVLVEVR